MTGMPIITRIQSDVFNCYNALITYTVTNLKLIVSVFSGTVYSADACHVGGEGKMALDTDPESPLARGRGRQSPRAVY